MFKKSVIKHNSNYEIDPLQIITKLGSINYRINQKYEYIIKSALTRT